MRWRLALLPLAAAVVAACGGGDDDGASAADQPQVVVTTNILGDVVENLVGDAAEVVTIMPVGANPHDFQPSARQAAGIREADLVIVNGAGFEEGLLEVVESAEADGVVVHEAISTVEPLEGDGHGHGDEAAHEDEHADEHGDEHAHEDDHAEDEHAHEEEDGHDHDDGTDPHFFTDPARMAVAAQGILDALVEHVPALDTDEVRARAADYLAELEAVDAEVEEILAAVPEERRVLVTNHEVFGYFADRYGFEVVGTVIPGGTTSEGADAANLADLIEEIRHEQVPAIFADTSSPADLARSLAGDVGEVEVVELFSESLGVEGSGGETYLDMVRTNAERIADALA